MRLRLCIIFAAFWQGVLVVPNVLVRPRPLEEYYVRWDGGVGRKHPVRQSNNCVDVEFFQQFLFDASADAVARQHAVRYNYRRTRRSTNCRRIAMQFRMISCRNRSAVSEV